MVVQWFPGHMHATRKAMAERSKEIDVVIEMLDARLPGSSANPLLADLMAGKPALKVLNKQDLADPVQTEAWLAHYNAQPLTQAIALDASHTAPARALVTACQALAPGRGGLAKPLRVLIGGVPNVGKSTLINTLKGKKATKTGDEAGVTKTEQRILLADDVYLYDTPGILWPRITIPETGDHLAASGAVGRNAYDEEEIALSLLKAIKRPYGGLLDARYKLGLAPEAVADATDDALLGAIGRRRGALLPGGRPNPQKAAEILLTDFRSGVLGRITLETPADFVQWRATAEVADAERAERQAARQAARRGARKT
jgi:ribosome biogenesis GTPase A